MTMNRIATWLAILIASLSAGGAGAQTYPTKPVKIIVGFAPGGGSDFIARVIAQKLTERLGSQVIVENRPGAGSVLGSEVAVKSPPDGYTLLLTPASYTVNANVYKLSFDPLNDITPIVQLSRALRRRGASFGPGENAAGAGGARQEGPGQARLRFFGQRKPRARGDRVLFVYGRNKDHACSLQGTRPGSERSHRGNHPAHLRPRRDGAPVRQVRTPESPRGHHPQAHRGRARRPHGGRVRIPELRGHQLARPRGSQGTPEERGRAPQQGGQRGAEVRGRGKGSGKRRPRARGRLGRRIRRHPQGRSRALGSGREASGSQGGLAEPTGRARSASRGHADPRALRSAARPRHGAEGRAPALASAPHRGRIFRLRRSGSRLRGELRRAGRVPREPPRRHAFPGSPAPVGARLLMGACQDPARAARLLRLSAARAGRRSSRAPSSQATSAFNTCKKKRRSSSAGATRARSGWAARLSTRSRGRSRRSTGRCSSPTPKRTASLM